MVAGELVITIVKGSFLQAASSTVEAVTATPVLPSAAASTENAPPRGKKSKRKHAKDPQKALAGQVDVSASAEGDGKEKDGGNAADADASEEVDLPAVYHAVHVSVKGDVKKTEALVGGDAYFDETFTFKCLLTESDRVIFTVMKSATAGFEKSEHASAAVITAPELLSGQDVATDLSLRDDRGDPVGSLSVKALFVASPPKDTVDAVVEKLRGPRPNLLRVGYAYGAAKDAYSWCAGLPILRSVTPLLEGTVETVLSHTPLKATPEGGEAHKAVANLDRTIAGALEAGDGTLDAWKDWGLACVKSGKDKVKGLKPEDKTVFQASVDGVKYGVVTTKDTVTGTTYSVYSSVTGFVGGLYTGALNRAGNAYTGTKDAVGSVYSGTKSKVGSAYGATTDVAGRAVSGVKSTASSAVDGVKGVAYSAYEKASGIVSSVYGGTVGRLLGK